MNNPLFSQALRFIFIVLIQSLVFKRLNLGWENFNYMAVMIYPIFLLLLPNKIPNVLLVALGFVLGISIDIFYDSPGVHASAACFTAFLRPLALRIFEPRGGYSPNGHPSRFEMGLNSFLGYVATMLAVHLFVYFAMEAFSLVYIGEILAKTVISFFPSMLFVMIYQSIFDRKQSK